MNPQFFLIFIFILSIFLPMTSPYPSPNYSDIDGHIIKYIVNANISTHHKKIYVDAKIFMKAGQEGNGLILYLTSKASVSEVRFNGNSTTFHHYKKTIKINLTSSVNKNDIFCVEIKYEVGVDENFSHYWDFIDDNEGWVRDSSYIFPNDRNASLYHTDATFEIDGNFTVVSQGYLHNFSRSDEKSTYRWISDINVRGVSFAYGKYNILKEKLWNMNDINIFIYYKEGHMQSAIRCKNYAYDIISYYSKIYGNYFFKNMTIVEVSDIFPGNGYALSGYVLIGERFFTSKDYHLLSHEIAHQWWGVGTRGSGVAVNFLQEAFASYSEILYEYHRDGTLEYLERCRYYYINNFVPMGNKEPTIFSNDYFLCEKKGVWILHMLRYIVGNETFFEIMSNIWEKCKGDKYTLNDFISYSLKLAKDKENVEKIFDRYIYSNMHTDVKVIGSVFYRGENNGSLEVTWDTDWGPDIIDFSVESPISKMIVERNRIGYQKNFNLNLSFIPERFSIDPFNWILDIDPSNNAMMVFDEWIDVSVISLNATIINDKLIVVSKIRMEGSIDSANILLSLRMDGNRIKSEEVSLKRDEIKNVSWKIKAPAFPGNHTISLFLDSDDKWHEINESNNIAKINISQITTTPLSDLYIMSILIIPREPSENDRISVEVEIGNCGDVASPATNITLKVGEIEYIRDVDEMEIDEICYIKFGLSLSAGDYIVEAYIDKNNKIKEKNEDNNYLSKNLHINMVPVGILSVNRTNIMTFDDVRFEVVVIDDDEYFEYMIDFGDGNITDWTNSSSIIYNYSDDGEYCVRINVRDVHGVERGWSEGVSITVKNREPYCKIKYTPSKIYVGTVVSFKADAIDYDGKIVTYTWKIMNKTKHGEKIKKIFNDDIEYKVILVVEDDDGGMAKNEVLIKVLNTPPKVALSGQRYATEGENLKFKCYVEDIDDNEFIIVWNFGDGCILKGKNLFVVNHTYRNDGIYTLNVTVSDDDSESAYTSLNIFIYSKKIKSENNDRKALVIFITLIVLGLIGIRRR